MMNDVPRTIQDLEALVSSQVPESVHLEYKRSLALRKNNRDAIAKHVSAFANADGGVLIFGVVEENHVPQSLDGGVPISELGREWLENVVVSSVHPRIPNLEIVPIVADTDSSCYYVISVGKSYMGPHQAPDKKYHKRYDFRAAPMEHYEIVDVQARGARIMRLVDFSVTLWKHFFFVISIQARFPLEIYSSNAVKILVGVATFHPHSRTA